MIIWNQKVRCGNWLLERVPLAKSWLTDYQAIGCEIAGDLVAVVVYERFTGWDIDMSLAVDKRATKGFVREAFRYPFVQLECQRVSSMVAVSNTPCRRLIERLGFKVEGIKRRALPDEDMIHYGLTKAECRWLT